MISVQEWLAKGGKLPKDSDFKLNCLEAVNNATATIEEDADGGEIKSQDVLETIFECLFCRRPFLCAPSKVVKGCNRFTCRYLMQS